MTRGKTNFNSPALDQVGAAGLTMADILTLPDEERQLITWMTRQTHPSVSEIAAYLDQDEATTRLLLEDLTQRGFIQAITNAGEVRYRVRIASKQGSQLSQNILQAIAPGNPLVVIPNPSGDASVTPGTTFELCVTVTNNGNQSALIDIYIDEVAQVLRQWCQSPNERLALATGQSSEVVFYFQVPTQATPGTYPYMLVVDAPQHYPEHTPIRYSQRLQVLPPVQSAVRVNDPTFTLEPPTTSFNPATLQPGEHLQVQVQVDNRSDRVDRFRLICPDLPESWYTVRYPQGIEQLGVITQGDGLALNPGEKGQILLIFHPPLDAPAGNYVPTVRLYSVNNPDLSLLDLVYLQITPVYTLTTDLKTILGRVKKLAGLYEVRLHNDGNVDRHLTLRARGRDEDELGIYTLEPDHIHIPPKQAAGVSLQVKPTKWWRRPFYGQGLPINFQVELEDVRQYPLPQAETQGTLVWEPRPWWQFLLLLLTGLGVLGVLIFLIWWLFLRPPAPPKILEFVSQDAVYEATEGDTVRLNWQIRHPRQLHTIRLAGVSPDGRTLSEPVFYDFSRGIPAPLKEVCSLQEFLVCRNVLTDARKPGDYIFEMAVFSRREQGATADSMKTGVVSISPVPLPRITEFYSTQPIYQEAASSTTGNRPPTRMLLNWDIRYPSQIKELKLIGRAPDGSVSSQLVRYDLSQGIPPELKNYCTVQDNLICRNVPAIAAKPGSFVFELAAVSAAGEENPTTKKTDTIQIRPRQIVPRVSFLINGQEAAPKVLVDLKQVKKPLILTWKVEGSKELRVELLPAPGHVPLVGSISYPIKQPGQEVVMLKVTAPTGEQLSRSIAIEVFDSTPPVPPAPPTIVIPPPNATANTGTLIPPGGVTAPGGDGRSPVNAPVNIDIPPTPTELPPKFD